MASFNFNYSKKKKWNEPIWLITKRKSGGVSNDQSKFDAAEIDMDGIAIIASQYR